ncbi:MAG: glycosyltransferase family 2 protein [Anaerolineae bacterium]|nr:glycosyltransferase family 2 protein [Anaerolineae bacterium]
MRTVSIVVPVYYNELNLPHLFPRLLGLADANPQYELEYVFVDDGSGDNSFEILTDLAKKDPRVRVVRLSRNFGANAAILAGLNYVLGDCVAIIAADLQDPPELITTMLRRWEAGKKVVLAARESREDPMADRLLSSAFYWLFRRFAIQEMPANGCDFVLIDREVANMLVQIGEKNPYLIGLILWLGFDRDVVYYTRQKREVGKSKWTLAKRVKYFIDALVSFTYVPMRLVSLLGIASALAGFVWAVIVVLNRILSGIPVQGWASLMTVVLVVSGVQLLTLGIFGEYLWRNFEETRKRPSFVVDQLIGMEKADAD